MDDGVGESIMWMSDLCEIEHLYDSFDALLEEWENHADSSDAPLHTVSSMLDLAGYKAMLWEMKLWLRLQHVVPIDWPTLFQSKMRQLAEQSNRLNKLNQLRRTT
jgi:hypothetical protein